MSKEHDAYDLIKKAEEKQNPGFFSKIFSSKNSRLEESLDYLEKAANIFKLLKKWEEAGNTYEKCGNIQLQLQNDPTNFLIESAHCFSFVDIKKSLAIKKKIVENYSQNGRFMNAGKYQQQIAEKYEELFDYPNAIKEYKLAADYFSMETMNAKSYEQNCLLKYCDLMCSIENNKSCYPEASDVSHINFRYMKKLHFITLIFLY